MENKVKFRIGEIEFEAQGTPEVVERERDVFLKSILPAAVDAVVRTQNNHTNDNYIGETISNTQPLLIDTVSDMGDESNNESVILEDDLSRINLTSFISNFGELSERDFVLFSAYFDEKKNGNRSFSSETVKQFYNEARRKKYSNYSALLNQLVQKGLIMDDPDAESKNPKKYILSSEGIKYVESYTPKESTKKESAKKKARTKQVSKYSNLSADDLNLKSYPNILRLKKFIEQMILVMYIIQKENKGDSFTVCDLECLLIDILGLSVTKKQIQGVFDRHKSWFKVEVDPDNQKIVTRKLLQGAKDFAEEIIRDNIPTD